MKYQAIIANAEQIESIDSLSENLEDRGVVLVLSDEGLDAKFLSPGEKIKIRATIHYTVVADESYDKDDYYHRRYSYRYITVFSKTKPKVRGKARHWKEKITDKDVNDNNNYVSFHERLTQDWSMIKNEWSVVATNINRYHGLDKVLDFLISVYTDEDDQILDMTKEEENDEE